VINTTVAHPPDLAERTLVCELTHRINNQFASAINLVTAAAVRAEHPETKVALGNVTELLQEQANVHRLLAAPEGDSLVDAVQYLRSLCLAITRSFGANRRPSLVSSRHLAARTGAVLAPRDGRPRAGDECSAARVLRRPTWRD
jgi:two-component sensor histidine kinase